MQSAPLGLWNRTVGSALNSEMKGRYSAAAPTLSAIFAPRVPKG
jgi:hypothetical protein